MVGGVCTIPISLSLTYLILYNFVFNWLILEIHTDIPSILHNIDKCCGEKTNILACTDIKELLFIIIFLRKENLGDDVIRARSIGV